MAKLTNYFTISSDTDTGTVSACTAAAASATLAAGVYKVAAMGTPMLWKLGPTNVTTSTGSYLASGDQEVIYVEVDNTKLSWIRSPDATADGNINYVPVQLVDLPGRDYRKYA